MLHFDHLFIISFCNETHMWNIYILEVRGPSGPQLLVGGPSGRLDFVLRALRALRPRLTHQTRAAEILLPTDGRTNKAILGVGRYGNFDNFTHFCLLL